MKPFLKSVAEAYLKNMPDMTSVCFVFPNKRSGTFFLKHLKDLVGTRPVIAPHITTISDFVADHSGLIMAGRIELLFLLYEEYCNLTGTDVEFDSFRSWGEVVISDFSDVDMYDVDAAEIFKNLKDFKDIRSNYLTEEQKEVMSEYFGADVVHQSATDSFWRHFNSGSIDTPAKKKFLLLWETLGPLYDKFSERLQKEGLCYNGMAYRMAYKRLKQQKQLEYTRIVFVGFNVLSTIEWKIFDMLQGLGIADFYWDCTGPAFSDPANTAGYFIIPNRDYFHSRYDISESNTDSFPSIVKVVSSPSNSAQSKIVGEILSDLANRVDADSMANAEVAVVLPDENLLLSLLHSLPGGVETVNLTMGYSLRLTPVASFVSLIRRLQSTRKGRGASTEYYHEDVRLLIAHPFVCSVLGEATVSSIRAYMDDKRMFMIPLSKIAGLSPEAEFVFSPIDKDATPVGAVDYLDNLLCFVRPYILRSRDIDSSLDCMQLDTYRDALCRLRTVLVQYGISMKYRTVFHLADRLLGGETVRFEGEPLKGVQIMGVLETRCLDFDYVIIPSMNERIFPRRLRSRSFIPDSLRRGYSMATIKYQESIFAYYFYRLISRAREVAMIYDARTSGLKSGDVSRYILQLKYLYLKDRLDWEVRRFSIAKSDSESIEVAKNGRVLSRLDEYCDFSIKLRNLSASSLYNYLSCPMKFYFSSILDISEKGTPDEYMDAAMQGTVFHNVMQRIYTPGNEAGHLLPSPKIITADFIDRFINDPAVILNMVEDEIRRSYLRIEEGDYRPLDGDVEMIASVICEFVIRTLRHDRTLVPFSYLGSEVDRRIVWTLPSGRNVNIRCMIDRVDMINSPKGKVLRLVDYKTGSVHRNFDSVADIFDGTKRLNAAFQLLFYSNLYAKEFVYEADIRPTVYEVLKFDAELKRSSDFDDSDKEGNFKLAGEPLYSYLDINSEFTARLNGMIEEIFSTDRAFTQTCDADVCRYCNFSKLCQR